MTRGRIAGVLLSCLYLVAVGAAAASALSPDTNHPGVYLILLTVPWSALLLPLLDWVAPNAPNWVGAAALVFGVLLTVAAAWGVARWAASLSTGSRSTT